MAYSIFFFTGNNNGPTIEEFIKIQKSLWQKHWKCFIVANFKDEAVTWWESPDRQKHLSLPNEEFEKVFLDKWSHARKQENKTCKGLFSNGMSLLQVHQCIQKEKIILFINPSCKYNFINVHLSKILHVPAK